VKQAFFYGKIKYAAQFFSQEAVTRSEFRSVSAHWYLLWFSTRNLSWTCSSRMQSWSSCSVCQNGS